MKVTYDSEARALYIKIYRERGNDGYCEDLIPDEVVLDMNKYGQITGIEIMDVESFEDITNKKEASC